MDGGRDRKGKDVPKAYSTRRRHNNTTITCVMMSHRNYVKAASQGIPLPLFPKTIIIVAVGCFPVIFLRRRTGEITAAAVPPSHNDDCLARSIGDDDEMRLAWRRNPRRDEKGELFFR